MGAEVFLDGSAAGADFAGSEKFKSSRIKMRCSQKCKDILELETLAKFLPYTSRHPLILPKGLSDSHGKKYMLCTYPSPKEKTLK